jgi:chromosomal replication initiation ATPase DnaA
MEIFKIWENSQKQIKESIGETSYETWFSSINVRENDQQSLEIETPDEFFKNWIEEHYLKVIQDVIHANTHQHIDILLSVNNNLFHEKQEKNDRDKR